VSLRCVCLLPGLKRCGYYSLVIVTADVTAMQTQKHRARRARDFLEERCAHEETVVIEYHYWPLAVTKLFFLILYIVFLAYILTDKETVVLDTRIFFDASFDESTTQRRAGSTHMFGVYSNNRSVSQMVESYGGATFEDLVISEAPDVYFLTSHFEERFEKFGVCDSSGDERWCPMGETLHVFVNMSSLHDIVNTVISRAECISEKTGKHYVFSNFNSSAPEWAPYYAETLRAMLQATEQVSTGTKIDSCSKLSSGAAFSGEPSHTSWETCCQLGGGCEYVGFLHGRGLDIVVQYEWRCALDKYSDPSADRYECAYENLRVNAFVLSSSATVDRLVVIEPPEDVTSGAGEPVFMRKVRRSYGVRLRFAGAGSCTERKYKGATSTTSYDAQGNQTSKLDWLELLAFVFDQLASAERVTILGGILAAYILGAFKRNMHFTQMGTVVTRDPGGEPGIFKVIPPELHSRKIDQGTWDKVADRATMLIPGHLKPWSHGRAMQRRATVEPAPIKGKGTAIMMHHSDEADWATLLSDLQMRVDNLEKASPQSVAPIADEANTCSQVIDEGNCGFAASASVAAEATSSQFELETLKSASASALSEQQPMASRV